MASTLFVRRSNIDLVFTTCPLFLQFHGTPFLTIPIRADDVNRLAAALGVSIIDVPRRNYIRLYTNVFADAFSGTVTMKPLSINSLPDTSTGVGLSRSVIE